MEAGVWSNIVSGAAGLLGALIGGAATWFATEKAAKRSAKEQRRATREAAEAALRLSRIERLDPLVENLVEEAVALSLAIQHDDPDISDLAFVQALGPVWVRVQDVSPQFSRLLREANRKHRSAWETLGSGTLTEAQGEDWEGRAVVTLLAIVDMCHEWLRSVDAFEGRGTIDLREILDQAAEARGWEVVRPE